jgi:hypothetical protein
VLAQHTFLRRADARYGVARLVVARVGLEFDAKAAQPFEAIFEQQQLGGGIDRGPLPGRADEGPTDLDPPMFGGDRPESSRADDPALSVEDGEGQRSLPFPLLERLGDEVVDLVAAFQRLRKPARDARADGQRSQMGRVVAAQRFQTDEVVMQRNRAERRGETGRDQLPPRSEMVPKRRRSAFSLMKPSASFWL